MSFWSRLRLTSGTCSRVSRITPHVRTFTKMAQTSPFTNAVVASMRKLYPEVLADKAWDNTGLLLEAPFQPHHPRKANSVLLTIDLTKAVVDEAIQGGHSVIVAYHPVIFRGLKALTLGDTQQQSLLKLAGHGISVYCPHTAVDSVPGGMADWLCDVITGQLDGPDVQARGTGAASQPITNGDPKSSSKQLSRAPVPQKSYSKPNYVPSSSAMFHPDTLNHTRTVITPSPSAAIDAANSAHRTGPPPYSAKNTGAGRMITFEEEQPLGLLISRIAAAVGHPRAFPLAIPQGANIEDMYIGSVGLCPGSGSSVIKAANPSPDLVFTGEVSHHDALAIIERGGAIISLFHSNSERGYLNAVMKPKLEAELKREWKRMQGEPEGKVSVVVSRWDRDPFGIVVLEDADNIEFEPVEVEPEPQKKKSVLPAVESAPAAASDVKAQSTTSQSAEPAAGTKTPQPEAVKPTPPPAPPAMATPIPPPVSREDVKTQAKDVATKEVAAPASQTPAKEPPQDEPKKSTPTAAAPAPALGAKKETPIDTAKTARVEEPKSTPKKVSQNKAVADASALTVKSEAPVPKEAHDEPSKKPPVSETSTAADTSKKDPTPSIAGAPATSQEITKDVSKEAAEKSKDVEPPEEESAEEVSATKSATKSKDAETKKETPSAPPSDTPKAVQQDVKPPSSTEVPSEAPEEPPITVPAAVKEAAKPSPETAAPAAQPKSAPGGTDIPKSEVSDSSVASSSPSVKASEKKEESTNNAAPAKVEQKEDLPAGEKTVDSTPQSVPKAESAQAPVPAPTKATEAVEVQEAKHVAEVKAKDAVAEKPVEGPKELSSHDPVAKVESTQAPTPAPASVAKEAVPAPNRPASAELVQEASKENLAKPEPSNGVTASKEAAKEITEAAPKPAAATTPSKPQEPTPTPQSAPVSKAPAVEAPTPTPTTAKVPESTSAAAAPANPPVKVDAQAPKPAESRPPVSEPVANSPQPQPPVAKEIASADAAATAGAPAAAPPSGPTTKNEVQPTSTPATTAPASTPDVVKNPPKVEKPASSTPEAPVKAPETESAEAKAAEAKLAEAKQEPAPEAAAKSNS